MPNNSMDVRAKHGRCFLCQLAWCFAPRHLNRSAFRGFTQPPQNQEKNQNEKQNVSEIFKVLFVSSGWFFDVF